MGYEQILYEVRERIATVTLNRPDKLNAWTAVMGREVRQAMGEAARDEAVRVIMLTGTGRGFCAGADMQLLSGIVGAGRQETGGGESGEAPGGDGAVRPAFRGPYAHFPTVPKPMIAALDGATAGLGLVVSLYCDLRIAADTAVSASGILKNAPAPNPAKLLMEYLLSREGNEVMVKHFQDPVNKHVKSMAGAKPIAEIKTIRPSPAEIEKGIPEVKEQFRETFGI